MPPTTMTTKVVMSTCSPMPICTERIGPTSTPASPASRAPSPKTSVKSPAIFTPSAATISRLSEPARISMPSFVRAMTYQSPSATSTPTPMTARR